MDRFYKQERRQEILEVPIDTISQLCIKYELDFSSGQLDILTRLVNFRADRSTEVQYLIDNCQHDNDDSPVENRGVKLALLQVVRDLALVINSDRAFWSNDRVSNLIVGNRAILETGCRFGEHIDPATTLTFVDGVTCSLIDMLKRDHMNQNHKHPLLNISYEEAVGVDANIFISFAYADNFIELVDALEVSSVEDPNTFHAETTFYWFDMFVNNQWKSKDRDFNWWTTLFRDAIHKIGHTLCFISPWNKPTLVEKAWCLYEISCSKKISLALSRKQNSNFQRALRVDVDYRASICKINLENATCREERDREDIFKAVGSLPGGIQGFNNKVVGLLRNWFASSVRNKIAPFINCGKNTPIDKDQLDDIDYAATLLFEQGKYDEARVLYEKSFEYRECIFGLYHKETLSSLSRLADVIMKQGNFSDAITLHEKALAARERILGANHVDTLSNLNSLGRLYHTAGNIEHSIILSIYERSIQSCEIIVGPNHPMTLSVVQNIALLFQSEGKFNEASKMFRRVLEDRERVLGFEHPDTLTTVHYMGKFFQEQNNMGEAKVLYERAYRLREITLGPDHPDTMQSKSDLQKLSSEGSNFGFGVKYSHFLDDID